MEGDVRPFEGRGKMGEGWRGVVGRAMVRVGRGYWIGEDEWEEERGKEKGLLGGRSRWKGTLGRSGLVEGLLQEEVHEG
jgi:hypothetical protein